MIADDIAKALKQNFKATIIGDGDLPSYFAVTELAAHSIGAVGVAIAELLMSLGLVGKVPDCTIERRLASLWFGQSIEPVNWKMPPIWDEIAGDYQAKDGWIKLHTNIDRHKKAALCVLACQAVRSDVARVIKSWTVDDLEHEIVTAGGVAAAMRSQQEWSVHSQGIAVASEPLIGWSQHRKKAIKPWCPSKKRPLEGLFVLDLTRVLAGPVATRTLAGFGASVLRVDPYGWEEPNVVPDITLGKRCTRLNLRDQTDRGIFEDLLNQAHVLVHGFRPDALEGLGYDLKARLDISPNIIEVKLNAYGWTGPWRLRRGFDSLVQMSSGIADAGMKWAKENKPIPLPVQALDHATGYLMAAAIVHALNNAVSGKGIANAHLSLARTAKLLAAYEQKGDGELCLAPQISDFSSDLEITPWGDARRLKPPIKIEGTPMEWQKPACELGSSGAAYDSNI
ncbi:CoA transferase, CAIB/BAIF family [hydrothermal vent metagenome]|uniref:CoA transferase, CAIB/BAIF family n=1 Tax=hydrothermal vent metagenome TaxID=652676 RepID=A0A3B0SJA0_9ZZZZ